MKNNKAVVITISLLIALMGSMLAQAQTIKPACEQISVEGKIEAVSDDTVTVEGTVFRLKEGIIYKNGSKENLKVGVLIDIRAKKEDEVNWFAWKITFLETEGAKKEFQGKIEHVSDTGITVNGTFIYVNEDTQFIQGTKENLVAGVFVKVKASFEQEAWIASQIHFGKDTGDPEGEKVEMEGLITNLSPGLVTIGETAFKVSAATKYYNTRLNKLEIGMLVKVIGYLKEEKYYAEKIYLLDKKNGEIKTLTDSILLVAKNVETGEVTLTLSKGDVVVAPGDFPVHGRTGLEAYANDLLPLQIVRIKLKGETVKSINVTGNIVRKGKITALITDQELDGFVMNDKNFYLDDLTEVKDLRVSTSSNDIEFEVDMKVLVIGNRMADDSVLADRIIIEPGKDNNRIYEFGVITGLILENETVKALTMNGYEFILPANLKISVSKFAGELPHEELIAGLTAKIRGFKNDDGDYVIKKITVYLPFFCIDSVVQEAAEDFILIDDYKVHFRDETKFSETEWPTSMGEIVAGDKIQICFILWTNGDYVATKVLAGE